MRDHVWVLFVLADISKYFQEANLPKVAAVLEKTLFSVEAEILKPPSKTSGAEILASVRCAHNDLPDRSNVHDITAT